MTTDTSHLGDSVCYAEIQVNKMDISESTMGNKPPVWPTVRRSHAEEYIYVCMHVR